MNWIKDTIQYILEFFRFWIILEPWEKGLRIRLGKNITLLEKGIHFRLPVFDSIYIQNTRVRLSKMAPQTVSTKDGSTVTLIPALEYKTTDVFKLYNNVQLPEMTVESVVKSEIAKLLNDTPIKDLSIKNIELKALESLASYDYGLEFISVRIVGYAVVQTFRLIQDQEWSVEGLNTTYKQ